jgi:hypothetical protein
MRPASAVDLEGKLAKSTLFFAPIRPVEFGEALRPGTLITLIDDDKPDRIFTVIETLPDKPLAIRAGDTRLWPAYHALDEEGRIHLLVNEPDEQEWWIWRPDHEAISGKSIFTGALVKD